MRSRGGSIADRGAADRGQHREAAGVAAKDLISVRRSTRQTDGILKPISAGLTGPNVPNTIIRQMSGPFWRNDVRMALRTLIPECSVHERFLGFRPPFELITRGHDNAVTGVTPKAYRQAAGAFAEAVIRSVELISSARRTLVKNPNASAVKREAEEDWGR